MSILNNSLLLDAPAGGAAYQINRSLRFNRSDSANLSRTPGVAGNLRTWTFSCWVKRTAFSQNGQTIFTGGTNSSNSTRLAFDTSNRLVFENEIGGTTTQFRATTAVYRDSGAWMHIVLAVDTTLATAADRVKLWVNGVQVTAFDVDNAPTQNLQLQINAANVHYIGQSFTPAYANFYLADVYHVDGLALQASNFGGTNAATGAWDTRTASGITSYGTCGFRLTFSDNSATTATTLGKDSVGSNNWTPNNFSIVDAFNFSTFFTGSNSYISVADAAALQMRTGDFTIEFWLRFSSASSYQTVFDKGYTSAGGILIQTPLNSTAFSVYLNGSFVLSTTAVTTNTWNHYALVRSGSTVTMYLNGTATSSTTNSADFNNSSTLYIGGSPTGGGYFTNGYISNFRMVKGVAVYTSAFTPPSSKLSPITNTSLLTCRTNAFQDDSANAFGVLSTAAATSSLNPFGAPDDCDSLVDTPTSYGIDNGAGGQVGGNYCTLNPLGPAVTSSYLSDGNLKLINPGYTQVPSTFALSSGKWYWEAYPITSDNNNHFVGIGPINNNQYSKIVGYDLPNSVAIVYGTGGQSGYIFKTGSSPSPSGVTITMGDIIGIAYDADAKNVWFSKNGTWVLSGNPAAGTNPSWSSLTGSDQGPILSLYLTTACVNFGQRPFAYTAPSGFKALCDTNLPEGSITTSGTFTGNAVADGPCVWLNGVPTAMTINGNAVTFGTNADKLANGFKLRTNSTSYNTSGSNSYSITTTGAKFKYARAQSNP